MPLPLTTASWPAAVKFPSAMHHRALAARTKPRQAPVKTTRKTILIRVAQIVNKKFKQAQAIRKKPIETVSEQSSSVLEDDCCFSTYQNWH